jgi:hypothetical protein
MIRPKCNSGFDSIFLWQIRIINQKIKVCSLVNQLPNCKFPVTYSIHFQRVDRDNQR